MNLHADIEILYQLLTSFAIGTAIGVEREYRSKAAGLRTMIMICLGSTIFTQISVGLGGAANPDRIAASIVSGVGFLGAGVIFKDGLSITGITTATTIWIAAALGMAVGAGEYFISLIGGGVVLIVLIVFERVKNLVENLRQTRLYRISVSSSVDVESTIEKEFIALRLGFRRKRDFKTEQYDVFVYEIYGREPDLNLFNRFLRSESWVVAFEY